MTKQELEETLETMIDDSDIQTVVQALVTICYEKAEHVRSTWDDATLVKAWTKNAKALDSVQLHSTY